MWNEFLKRLAELRKSGEPFAVATVVKVSGSTYRRPGARVLMTADGSATGLISGGCFESDLIERARKVIETGRALTVTFDTTSPDDLIFGLGLGCTGVAQILLEPLKGLSGQDHLNFIHQCVTEGRAGVLATVFRVEGLSDVSVGDTVMIEANTHESNIENRQAVDVLAVEGHSVFEEGVSRVCKIDCGEGSLEALLELIPLPVILVIFGAGPDAVPLVRFAGGLGWKVMVIDKRPAYARPDRFPEADAVILCEPSDLSRHLSITSRTVVVIMSHHFETDLNFLKQVIVSESQYIGLLGPRAKAELLLQHLRDDGIVLTAEQMARIHSPVGLDLGAETPEEIALAVVSEIQAVRYGYPAGFLRDRSGPIHQTSFRTLQFSHPDRSCE